MDFVDIFPLIPIIGAFVFVSFFIRQMFTESGRLSSVKMFTKAEEATKLGEISSKHVPTTFGLGINQQLVLYKCRRGVENFYVVENTQKMFLSMTRTFIVLSPDAFENMKGMIESS